jgi:hypothetical protein
VTWVVHLGTTSKNRIDWHCLELLVHDNDKTSESCLNQRLNPTKEFLLLEVIHW